MASLQATFQFYVDCGVEGRCVGGQDGSKMEVIVGVNQSRRLWCGTSVCRGSGWE